MTDSVALKLDRAHEHLQAFEIEADAWINTHPYRIVDEPNPNPPLHQAIQWIAHHRRFRLDAVDPVPERLSLLIGDCLFNIRSSLDHLVLTLARSFTPHITDRQIATSEFPVFGTGPMDARTEARKIGCIDPAARDIIKALQPYHRGNNYQTHPLSQLHELNRIDKHRMLTICAAVPLARDKHGVGKWAVGFVKHEEWNISRFLYFNSSPGELIQNTVFARYGALAADVEKDVYMQPTLSIEIAFGNTMAAPLQPVVPGLQGILDFVCNSVVSPLSQFL